MSWHRTAAGKRAKAAEAVRTQSLSDPHTPAAVKSAVQELAGLFNEDAVVKIATNGHIDTDGRTGLVSITIETISGFVE